MSSVSWMVPILLFILTAGLFILNSTWSIIFGIMFFISLFGIRVIYEYEAGVRFRLGKYVGILKPGLNYFIPIFESIMKVDMRILTVDIPVQEVMTKDNVPMKIDAVVYFKVVRIEDAILKIRDYFNATRQYAQTALRDVIGDSELDRVLMDREKIAKEIKEIVDKETDGWGVDIVSIKLQHIELPENMKRTMAKQAEAEREKRAVIIKAEGEVIASSNLSKAARVLASSPGALHLRTLNTINDMSSDQSNTVIFAIPLEVLEAFEAGKEFIKGITPKSPKTTAKKKK